MRKKVLAEKSVKQGLNQFQFVGLFDKNMQKHPMTFYGHRVFVFISPRGIVGRRKIKKGHKDSIRIVITHKDCIEIFVILYYNKEKRS